MVGMAPLFLLWIGVFVVSSSEDSCIQKECSKQGEVCGSDGITYTSQCELEEAACMLPQDIKMVYTGQCEVSTLEVSDTHLAKQTLMFGKRGKIHCRFSQQVAQVRWTKIGRNGQDMAIEMPRVIPASETLRFRRVQRKDAGMYKCLAKSGSGQNVTTTVKVTIIGPEAMDSTVASYKVCHSPKLIGTGNNYTTRWYFERDSLKCKPFLYSGSGGNDNNYKDEFICMRKCAHAAPHFEVCSLHSEPGLCFGYFPRWYYNSASKQCELFVYGGCGGNANRFKSMEACDEACSAGHVCKLKPEKGRCLGYFVQYFYNSTSGQCEKFVYGGCDGNSNRFPALDMCQKTCKSGKLGICPRRRMMSLFCGERDNLCDSDTDCKGDHKCCFDGCRQACIKPVINQQKPGKCPRVTTAKQECEEKNDMCATDSNCPGTRKCCHNGCQRDCVIPQRVQRPKPGVCPVQDTIKPSLCKTTKPECKIDEDCFGRLKCCFNGCFQECLATPVPRPKPGLCPAVDKGSSVNCSGLRDRCSYDSQCPGRAKCCSTGCLKECTTFPVKEKLGECPLVDFIPPELCEDTTDKCKEDADCQGRSKCCATGCLRECITPPLRQKPGKCPAIDFLSPESCEDTTNKCFEDGNCPGKDKCCDTGCLKECLTPPAPLSPKKGQCPKPWKGLTGRCDRKSNECSDDITCSGKAKCCYNGCQKDCIEPTPVEKPGTCPKPRKGQDGICDRRGDMCIEDLECGRAEKCCFNGCQRDCVKPEAEPSKKHGRCPKPWKEQPCDRRGDICSEDKDCFEQFMCCHNGCQNDCVLPVNMTKCQQEKQTALDRLNLNPPPVGVFVPKCKPDGHYEDEQCQELYCWCVDRHGMKIPDTEVRGRATCFAQDKPGKCPRPWKGQLGFCDFRGDMCLKDNECSGDNRCCFNGCQNDCVPPVGTKLCDKHKKEETANTEFGTPLVGAFIPSCKLNGDYEDIQCHASTGYCWCVDKFGNEMLGTRTRRRPSCNVKEYFELLQGKNVRAGPGKSGTCPKPWKGVTGFCDKMADQCGMDFMCPGEEKCCFSGCQRICVNSTESHWKRETKPGQCPKPWLGKEGLCDRRGDMCQKDVDCKGYKVCCFNGCQKDCVLPGLTTCQQRYEESFLFPPLGRFVPQCKEDGNFDEIQCHSSTGHCWCVDSYGFEQLGTRIRGRPNCTTPDPCLSTTCDYYGQCVPTKDRKSVECKCNIACFLLHDPVCGTDGQTYSNECTMKSYACQQKRNITVAYKGKCAAVDLCSAVKCRLYAECDIVNGSVQCSCPGSGSRPDCTDEKKPICGSNGKIYDNLCYLKRESCQKKEVIQPALPGMCEGDFDPCRDVNCSHSLQECTLSHGKPVCSCSFGCTTIYDPVCGTDGKTYSSDCALQLVSCEEDTVVSVEYKGECRKLVQLSRLSVKVDPCAKVRCSHALARCMVVNGTAKCQCPFVMTLEYFPVCGSDGVTYPNPSSLDIASCNSGGAIKKVKDGKCSELADPCEISPCSHKFHTCKVINNTAVCICSTACTLEYDPVCGTNNKTYPNQCSLEVAECEGGQRLRVAYKGECGLIGTCPAPWKGHNGICDRRGDSCQDDSYCRQGKCCFNGCQRDCVRFGTLECTQKCDSNAQCIESIFGGRQCICNPGFHGDGLSCSADPCTLQECDNYATCMVQDGVGKCVCPAICPAIYLPVCGSDEKIYDNDCELRVASCTEQKKIVVASKEKCKPDLCVSSTCSHPLHQCVKTPRGATCMCLPSICTREYIPVCGSDGNTHPNQCVLKATACERSQNISVLHQGECKSETKPCDAPGLCTHPFHQCIEFGNIAQCVCPMIIPTILDPVCGSDGQTYPNSWALKSSSCLANRIVEEQRKGPCPTLVDPCDFSLCSHKKHVCRVVDGTATCVCSEICPLLLQPVCGSDGMSYPNLCTLEVESCKTGKQLEVVRIGQCDRCAYKKCSHSKHYCKVVDEVATCVCNEICPLLWNPVCGSDGKMYPNNCSLQVEACKTGQHLTVVQKGECPKPECPLLNPTPACAFQPDTCLTGNKTCDSGLVCCSDNDCTIKCTLPALPDGSRPGQCPVLNRTPLCSEITGCDKDETCPLGERCCLQKDCTRKCIKTEVPPPPSEVTGSCPLLNPTPSCLLLPDDSPSCFSGGVKCPPGKACCLDRDCTHKCVRAALSDGSRPGQCPVLNRIPLCGEITGCDKDETCPLGERCCLQKDCTRKCIKTDDVLRPALRLTLRRQNFLGALTCDPPCHRFAKCIKNLETGKLECSCKRPCPRHYSPVCGTDGKTYGNQCMLKFLVCERGSDTTLKHPGECKEAACPMSLCTFPRPVCKVVKGTPTCFCRKLCPALLDPVCGSDGRTYDNMCLLERAACIYEEGGAQPGILKYLGNGNCTAAQICSLPAERGKCRAAMRRYFFNATSMKCEVFKFGGCEGNANRFDTEEECSNFCGSLDACQLNPCPDPYAVCTESDPGQRQCACPKICPEDFSPVCGTDGNTYNNNCQMKVTACKQGMMIKVKSKGPCRHNPGVCPPVDPRPCPEDLFDECFDDGNCEDSQKCCYDGCRKSCAFSLSFSNSLQLQSPALVPDSTPHKASCKTCLDFRKSCEPGENKEGDCQPVCGTDGRNYSSYCVFLEEACKPENVGVLKLKHRGACVCDLPPVVGPCKGYISRFYFNSTSKQCEWFSYGGCGGNDNKFKTVKSCEDMCISPCKNHKCPFRHSPCDVKEGLPVCKCPLACTADYRPVCGTDGRTYGNLCGLEATACRKKHLKLEVLHVGECSSPNPCETFRCEHKRHRCVVKQNHPVCICRKVCTKEYEPVCSSDGKTYPNKCTMEVEGCESGQNLAVIHDGSCSVCDLPPVKGMCEAYMPSFFFNSTSKQCERFIYGGCGGNGNRFSSVEDCVKKCTADTPSSDDPCQSVTCKHHGVCHMTEDGVATCKCITNCPDVDEPVCGSDGKTYSSECVLKSKACLNRVDVRVAGGPKKCSKRTKCKACPARYDLFSHFCNSDFVIAGKLKGIEANQARNWSELTVFVTDVFKGPNPPQNRIVKIAFTENLHRCYCKELDQLKTKSQHEILVAGSMIRESKGLFIDEWSYVHHFTHHLMHKAREITKRNKCAWSNK